MNKSTKSLLLVAMMAVSGFAAAQTAAPANDVKSGTQGGEGPSAAEKAKSGSMPNTRAEVKAQAAPMKSGTDGGTGPTAGEKAPSTQSRAEVKSGTTPMKAGTDGGEGPVANSTKMTAAERRAANASKGKRTPASKSDAQKDGKAAPN